MSVEISDLSKVFEGPEGDDIVAVKGFNLDIDQGEFIVLVGPSGCGKTTTLRCIAGLEIPSSGQILLEGEDITREAPQDRDIAMVFQNYALYPHLSVRANLGFGLKNRTSLSKEEIDSRVEEVAELMDIDDLLEKNPSELSGGQQQRVATGRAIVRDPEVFLFDEPLSNLDAKLRKHMRTEIQRIQDQLGTTSIYVTHDQEEAMTMADRIAVLRDGELYQVGSPSEIYNNPINTFVANFIGEPSMNMFEVEHVDGTISGEQFEFELSDELRELLDETSDLILGIRPEDMNVVDEGIMTMELEVLEELGSSNLLNITFGDDEIFIVKTESSVNPETGTDIDLDFDEDDIYLFDANTTETIVARGDEVQGREEGIVEQGRG